MHNSDIQQVVWQANLSKERYILLVISISIPHKFEFTEEIDIMIIAHGQRVSGVFSSQLVVGRRQFIADKISKPTLVCLRRWGLQGGKWDEKLQTPRIIIVGGSRL